MSEGRNGGAREAILDAAFRRFARYGYRRTSLGDIADEAGLSRPALYHYFRNKEDVFGALSLTFAVGLHRADVDDGEVRRLRDDDRQPGVAEAGHEGVAADELEDRADALLDDLTVHEPRRIAAMMPSGSARMIATSMPATASSAVCGNASRSRPATVGLPFGSGH